MPNISFKWLEGGNFEDFLINLQPEEIGFNDIGLNVVCDSERELIWHSSDFRIKAYPASKAPKDKIIGRESKYTLWAGEPSS